MKITDFSIVFVLIFVPAFLLSGFYDKDQQTVRFLELKYVTALRTAVQDGASVLNRNEKQEFEAGYGSEKFFRADKEEALAVFYKSLYANLGIEDDLPAQAALDHYIPAVAVIDYDGYYVYADEEYTGEDGSPRARHVWSPKKPFAYGDENGNLVRFTLDNEVEAYDFTAGQWIRGLQRELAASTNVPLLARPELFEQVRRTTIVQTIQNDLANVINRHNEFAAKNGASYLFTLPSISGEEWNNSIRDIGMMAFIQGIPVGHDYINNYALGGGRLVKRPNLFAGSDPATGIRYFERGSCRSGLVYEETFTDAKEASANGYFERSCYR
ncbi:MULTISPECIES: hypothetical protein [Paenibacillus]|uniref:F0F1-type ATP synthase n=1 Tax=Paenibacillus albilobatus TaxID=2716884 RepID=A0A919XGA4_9BACL|nr:MULTISPECIES: hypothetical protein [Paenibacillus]GIO31169.1 hypothetical protein J2TS6_23100 [Paenibacillus albilobatus]